MKVIEFVHCDLQKSFSSMSLPEEVFSDTPEGRAALLECLEDEIQKEEISLVDGMRQEDFREEVMFGKVPSINDYLDFGYVFLMDVVA